jgi:Protein of unknown function (DUF3309)
MLPAARIATAAGGLSRRRDRGARRLRLILLIVLIILVVGALPSWPYSAGWGDYPSGGLGTIGVIVIVLALVGAI